MHPHTAVPLRAVLTATAAPLVHGVTVVALLLVAVGGSLSAGPSLTSALALLGALTLASVLGVPRGVAARVAAAVLLVLTGRPSRPHVPGPEPDRQQDPSTPGRPQPRAPGATWLPLTA